MCHITIKLIAQFPEYQILNLNRVYDQHNEQTLAVTQCYQEHYRIHLTLPARRFAFGGECQLSTIQAIALGARHNIENLIDAGYEINLLTPAGGLAKNPLFIQEHCNATGLPAAMPKQPDAMLLAGVMTAGQACGLFASWFEAMQSVSRYKDIINPDPEQSEFYDKKICGVLTNA